MLPRFIFIVLCAFLWSVKGEDSDEENYDDHDPRYKIIGGLVVEINQAPYQVSLEIRSKRKENYRHRCGGSIISKDMVLTAAHCITGIAKKRFRIRAGSTYKSQGGTLHNIANYTIHASYNKVKHDYDIALMQVSEPFQFSDQVKTIELISEEPQFGKKALVSGWGRTSHNGASSDKLKLIELTITNRGVCSAIYDWNITPRMICAFDTKDWKDACHGDSGGPLVVDNKLAGIVSWGDECGKEGVPGVYTNVVVFKIWIEQYIGSPVKIWNAAHYVKLWLQKQKDR